MQNYMQYPLANDTWNHLEREAVMRVLDSGRTTMGPEVAKFEEQFAQWVGSKYCVMVNSGSSANLIAVASLFFCKHNPLKAGDEVLVPAVSWSTTYFPLQQYGLHIKFVDIDPDTLNFDLKALEEAITDKTRLIFAVNLLGNPNDFPVIEKMIAGKNITLIEDNCESMGASIAGKKAATWGLIGTHSTFFSHHMTTMEGGLIVTDNEELMQIMRSLRAHGWTRELPQKNHVCDKTDDAFQESFRFVLPGYCVRPTEIQGAIGQEQLLKIDGFIQHRCENAAYFMEKIAHIEWLRGQKELGESSWFGFSMVLRSNAPCTRSELVITLKNAGIDCRPVVAGNFVRNPVVKWLDYSVHNTLSVADDVHDNGLFVGNHHYPIREQIDHLISTINALNTRGAKVA